MSTEADNAARSAEGDAPEASIISTLGIVVGALGGVATVLAVIVYFIDPGAVSITVVNLAFAVVAGLFYGATNRATLSRVVSGRRPPIFHRSGPDFGRFPVLSESEIDVFILVKR